MENVQALRSRDGVVLVCDACKATKDIPEGRFDALSNFLGAHQPCAVAT